MKQPIAPSRSGDVKRFAAFSRRNFGAHFREFTGLGRSSEDAVLFLLVVGLFLHWIIACVAALAVALWICLSKKRFLAALRPRTPSLFLFGFLAFFALYSLLSSNPLSAVGFLFIFLAVLISFWVRSFMTRHRYGRMLDLSIAMSFYCALYGVVDRFVVHAADWEKHLMQSSTNNANYYGLLLVFFILTAFFRLEQTAWRERVFFYLSSVLVNFVMLLLTESISSFFGLMLGLLLFLFLYRHYKSFGVLVGALSALFTASTFLSRSQLGGTVLYIFLERVELWRIAWHSITERAGNFLLGQGLFSYQGIWNEASHGFWDVRGIVPRSFQPHAHSLYMEVLLSVGLIGSLLLLVYGAYWVLVLRRRAKTKSLSHYSLFSFVVCAALFFSNLADVSVFWMQTGIWFFLLCSSVGIPSDETRTL